MKMSEKNKNNNGEKEKRPMEVGIGIENTNRNKNETFKPYPKPLAKYTDVISDKGLFMQTLEKFHIAMKTKFMIPIIGGKDLDLHQLFIEVTSRGGIDKVIGDRRWKEVTASFTFPSTATNASFILRKYYFSLLQQYEQLYFLGYQGCDDTTGNMPSPVTQAPPKRLLEGTFDSRSLSQKRKIRDELPPPVNPLVTGVIDGKFEHGYFITVKIGSQTLRGVLYHCAEQPPPHSVVPPLPVVFNSGPSPMTGGSTPRTGSRGESTSGSPPFGARRQRRRRKKRPSTMDPNHPKPNRSGYNFFFKEQHARLKPLHPGKDRQISRMIGELWNNLTQSEKNVYQERGREDKQRYQSEMAVYKEKQKTEPVHVISDAVPINQRPATVEGVDTKVEEGDLVLAGNNDQNSYSDGTDDSEDGDKNQDLDVDTGSLSGSGSESDTSLDATLVRGEHQPTNVVGPPQQTGADGFELRKREVAIPSVEEVESRTVEDFSKSVEGNVKPGEGSNTPVEVDVKAGEGDLKTGEGCNDPVEGDVKTGEVSNDPVEGDVRIGEGSNEPVQDNVKVVEVVSNDPVDGGAKTGEDFNKPVDGDVKMGEVFKSDVKIGGEDFNSLAVGDIPGGEDFNDNPIDGDQKTAAEVTIADKMVENA